MAPSRPEDVPTEPIVMMWHQKTTPLEAIERAFYAMADQMSGVASGSGEDWKAVIYPRTSGANREALAHQMRQEVTDQTLRVRISERTDPIRNLVFAVAFSQSQIAPAHEPDVAQAEHT